jgi:hypothetical protein
VPLPAFILVPWQAIHEFRQRTKFQGSWVVDVWSQSAPDKAQVIGEAGKYESFSLVDAEVARLEAAE